MWASTKPKAICPMKVWNHIQFYFSSSKNLYCHKDLLKSDCTQGLPVYHSETLIIPVLCIGLAKISVSAKQAKICGSADFLGVWIS